MIPVDRPVRPEGDDTPPGYEDPYDYPELPIEKRLFLAAHSDLEPEFLYGWGDGDGAYDTITGLLADDRWRNDITIANTMGLVGDWGTDDVHEAVTNALHEYREMKVASAAPETSPTRNSDVEAWNKTARDRQDKTGGSHDLLEALRASFAVRPATPPETTEH